jgi:two-component system chemotaxis response regulator CheY
MDKQCTVLIADDSSFARRVISSCFVGTEFRIVASADSGASAIEQFKACSPDLVLLDVIMPDHSGAEVLKQIMEINPNAKVVMVSSLGTESMVTECLALGAKAFVQKPMDKQMLMGVLQKVLAG